MGKIIIALTMLIVLMACVPNTQLQDCEERIDRITNLTLGLEEKTVHNMMYLEYVVSDMERACREGELPQDSETCTTPREEKYRNLVKQVYKDTPMIPIDGNYELK